MLEWYHLLIGMQTTVLNIVLEVFVVLFFDCMLSSFRFIVHVELRFIKHNILITVINLFIMFNMLLNAGISLVSFACKSVVTVHFIAIFYASVSYYLTSNYNMFAVQQSG